MDVDVASLELLRGLNEAVLKMFVRDLGVEAWPDRSTGPESGLRFFCWPHETGAVGRHQTGKPC